MAIKFHPKAVVDFESNSKSVKSNKRFYSQKHQSESMVSNQHHIKMGVSVKNVVAITFMCPFVVLLKPIIL